MKTRRSRSDSSSPVREPIALKARAKIPVLLYIPNILCYIRVILSFISIVTASHISSRNNDDPIYSLGLTISIWSVASLLDHIDGKVARYWNQCSEFGVLLDVIADNILRGCTWICVIAASPSSSSLLSARAATATTISITSLDSEDQCDDEDFVMKTISTCAPMLGLFLISMEWFTMFSSQMLKIMKEKQHWKDVGQEQKMDRDHQHDKMETTHLVSHVEQFKERINDNQTTSTTSSATTSIDTIESGTAPVPLSPPPSPPPKFVQAVFANNFCNVFGILAMYGLFSIGMITFLYIHKCILLQSIPLLRIPLYVSFTMSCIGRLIALCTELWLCCEYMKLILSLDQENNHDF